MGFLRFKCIKVNFGPGSAHTRLEELTALPYDGIHEHNGNNGLANISFFLSVIPMKVSE